MIRYVVKRFLMLIPLVLCITFVVYGLMSLAPGDPASIMLPSNAPQEQKDALNHKLGYDRPFLVKYADFVYNLVFKGDFGISYRTQQPIINEFKTRLPISITLAFTSLTLAACIGIPLGVLSAVKQYSLLDTIPSVMALTLSAVPSFWFGMMLIYFLAYKLGLFPSYGMGGIEHWVLPTLTIAVVYAAEILRYTRSSMLEVIRQDYIRTAKAKGLGSGVIIFRHALRNGMIPVTSSIGLMTGLAMTGTIIIETIFNIPGLGTLMNNSISKYDYTLTQGIVLICALLICGTNLITDLVYALIDPRIRAQYTARKPIFKRRKSGVEGG